MRNKLGFSLTEMVVTVVIVSILALASVPVYRGFVKRGIANEGASLLGEINSAQQIYYARHGEYFAGTNSNVLGVGIERTKYFTTWTTQTGGNGQSFTATVYSTEGINLSLTGSASLTTAGEDGIIDNNSY